MDNQNASSTTPFSIFSMFKDNKPTPSSYYIIFLTIYILSFVCIFKRNVELIGYGLLYAINIFATIFCVKDLYIKLSNKYSTIFLSLIIVFILNIVSSSLFIVSISRIYKFSKDEQELVLSYQNKKKIQLYRDLFISILVSLWVVLFYIFISKEKTLSFDISKVFREDSNIKIIERIIEIIKFLLLAYPLALSSYLVYHANNLVTITRSLL
jgi:hypothetical protein